MSKFQVGDTIIQTKLDILANVIGFDLTEGKENCVVTMSDDDEAFPYVLYDTNLWEKVGTLPKMPESVLYRATSHELYVTREDTRFGDVFIGLRRDGDDYIFTGLHLEAEEVLSLCHDLRRYAMDAIRARKE